MPELQLPDADSWRAWLAEHHEQPNGVWLVLHKKGGSVTSLTYAQALDQALCFGWIDGQLRRRDEQSYGQRFTPRRPNSAWSARNVDHVARLEAAGLMTHAGLAQVRAAQADGRWSRAYAGQAQSEVPDDLLSAIKAVPSALVNFEALTKANRYALIYRVNEVKRPETRARRIATFVEQLSAGLTVHPQSKRP